jgi:hypothetical protein
MLNLANARGKSSDARRQAISEQLAGLTDVEKVRYGYQRGFAKAKAAYHHRHWLRALQVSLRAILTETWPPRAFVDANAQEVARVLAASFSSDQIRVMLEMLRVALRTRTQE